VVSGCHSHNCAEVPTYTSACVDASQLCALYTQLFRKFTQIRTMGRKKSRCTLRCAGALCQTAASPGLSWVSIDPHVYNITEHNRRGKAAVPFNSHSTENDEKLRRGRAWTKSSLRLSSNSSSRSDLFEMENDTMLSSAVVTLNIVVVKKKEEKRRKTKRSRWLWLSPTLSHLSMLEGARDTV